jgi:hypothetical protein
MDELLRSAERQLGLAATAEARSLGLTRSAIRHAAARGRIEMFTKQ